jgi:hypothetical protein
MITEKKIIANRANAKASTGPRTQLGKARVGQNARRHGLSLPSLTNPAQSAAIERLALAIVGKTADRNAIDIAQKIAEAQMDLVRIREVRRMICAQTFPISDVADGGIAETARTKMLIATDRYERRAFSRRKIAIRSFDALRE